ncbi:hypothetical protein WME90_44030 [Sorangium sp. So ce375]|uniref:RCC1 domain-containing protein n=1 Tax=Sorangium sp. So ce375 TaxID=3133306 RepID=UPI003F5C65F0
MKSSFKHSNLAGEARASRRRCRLVSSGLLLAALAASLLAGCAVDDGAETGDLEEPVLAASAALRVLGPGAIAVGASHTCAIFEGGFVKCWGTNDVGQLGYENEINRGTVTTYDKLPFVDLGTGRTAKAIAAGARHTCALLDNNTVKCWGDNGSGQLGLEINGSQDIGDAPGEMGDSLPPVNLGTNSLGAPHTAKAIFAGNNVTCAILEDNALKCWGSNGYGKLGLGWPIWLSVGDASSEMGDDLPAIDLGTGRFATSVAIAYDHVCALLNTGEVKCWGDNESGNLGLMSGDPGSPPHTTDRGDAPGEMGDNLPAVYLGTNRTAKAIAAGLNHTCAILDTNALKCWGGNNAGELGLGDTDERGDDVNEMSTLPNVNLGLNRTAKALTAGGNHTCVVLDNDRIKCWGSNSAAVLGLGDTYSRGGSSATAVSNLPYVQIGTDAGGVNPLIPVTIVADVDHTCIIESSHLRIKCWGAVGDGQLGSGVLSYGSNVGDDPSEMGNSLPYALMGSQTAQGLSVGFNHVCARLMTGAVKCWGYNSSGQLGLDDNLARGDVAGEMGSSLPNSLIGDASAVMAGSSFSCALKVLPAPWWPQTGIKCWGSNFAGRLGIGSTAAIGDSAGEMASLGFINLGTDRRVKSASVGNAHVCAVLDNDTVKCWGFNGSGQLGVGDMNDRGDSSGEMGNLLPAVDLGLNHTAKAVAAGGQHTCALLDDNTVKCWGDNGSGQLGLGNKADRGDQAGEMGANLPTVDLGVGRTAKSISAGYAHTCAVLNNNAVKCWGANGYGQLGIGNSGDVGDAATDMMLLPTVDLGPGRTAKSVSAGADHTCALLDDNTVKCWGRNRYGQLGLGDWATRGDGAGEMGGDLPRVDLGDGRTAKAVMASVTSDVTCALLDTNQIKCWGESLGGNLGGPGCAGTEHHCGDEVGEMGDALTIIDLGLEQ